MIHKVTVTKSWKSDDEKLIFFQCPELMCFSSDSALVKYMPVGSWFWAILKEPAQGKKAYRITQDCGEKEPNAEVKVPPQATASINNETPARTEIAPQAIGMCTKEIGDMIRAKYLNTIFGDEAQKELIKWYRSQVLGITRIPYDGSKLPTFETK